MLVPTLVIGACGMVQLGEPLDELLGALRDEVRRRPSSGEIVVVAKDNQSIADLGGWPIGRDHDARTVENLFAAGARRVFFDQAMADATNAEDDLALRQAIDRHPGRVGFAITSDRSDGSGERQVVAPHEGLGSEHLTASVEVQVSALGAVKGVPYAMQYGQDVVTSLSSRLTGRPGKVGDLFRPDFSIDVASIPTIPFSLAARNGPGLEEVRGKDVIVGPTASAFHDQVVVLGQGRAGGVFVQVVAAETLAAGDPRFMGWIPLFLLALGVSVVIVNAKSKRRRLVAGATGAAAIVLLPLVGDAMLLTTESMPALALLGFVFARARIASGSAGRDHVVGLPNLHALANDTAVTNSYLIGVRIIQFGELSASLGGEDMGRLLRGVAARLAAGSSSSKVYYGENTLFCTIGPTSWERVRDFMDGMMALVRAPVIVAGRSLNLAIAGGIDLDVDRSTASRVGSVLSASEEAEREGLRWSCFDDRRLPEHDWEISITGEIEDAIRHGHMWVAYQPKLDLRRNVIVGAEALVRWRHPVRGTIEPAAFVKAAERHDAIEELTWFVLETALADAAALRRSGREFSVAVNLSVRMLSKSGLVQGIRHRLDRVGMMPSDLTLEVTETGRFCEEGSSLMALHALRTMGVRIAIDDYGTGYASMHQLKAIPADEIKIDREFVGRLLDERFDRAVVHSTIELAHRLGRTVVAEGVEDVLTLDLLDKLGCDLAQGFEIGAPMSVVDLVALLDTGLKVAANT